jgi:hypothetical protein
MKVLTSLVPENIYRPMAISFGITILLLLISTIYFIIAQPVIPIFYTLARPAQQLAPKVWLFLFPGLSLLFNVSHLIVVRLLKEQDEVLTTLLAWVGVAFQVLLSLALLRIVYLTI